MNRFRSLTLISLTAVVLLVGCKKEPPKPPLVETAAVLLFDNASNAVAASDIMQRLVYLALKPSPYRVLDLSEVNAKLEKAGIIDGGQLAIADPTKLGKDLGVQALIYGVVESFNYTNIGFYTERKVALSLKMVEVSTGKVLWENTSSSARRTMTLDPKQARQQFAKGLADQLVDKMFDTPLEEEAKEATIKTLGTLPGYAYAGFAHDDKTVSESRHSFGKNIAKGALRTR